ncbi:Ca2+-binding EF-hand superfamily protein [Allocatelliglobosispora scoriae]|uniref:Ca2+-binding EF-hand superfamily protein n=1 Tax=Allocatelliglobosispora scoriae TaxID=643052 RepID=A0A841BKJ8_9ACTN|nr:EF-hand domain-containing protein [Allocatelliglobosispora scoriae]MBB5868804.1 Ca2+-binding EF-hand superfamily protein [Allocatelliglobosispora scoriae]
MTEKTLLSRKHDRAFGHLDRNGTGFIEREDIIDLGERVLSAVGEPTSSERGAELLGAFGEVWTVLVTACDRNADDKLDAREYHIGMTWAFVQDEEGYDRIFHPAVKAVMELADTDGDGSLQAGEFRAMQLAFGTPADEIDEAFAGLDRDGSGSLTVDELLRAARQFYTSPDDRDPGNGLFGRI